MVEKRILMINRGICIRKIFKRKIHEELFPLFNPGNVLSVSIYYRILKLKGVLFIKSLFSSPCPQNNMDEETRVI